MTIYLLKELGNCSHLENLLLSTIEIAFHDLNQDRRVYQQIIAEMIVIVIFNSSQPVWM